ncbi:hypothetical protein ZOSMA_15G00390 [Zostera marina]|uniref:Uncharacterized protein n=1 Tax=Zostera marina TaxID=29655 RepID=A0A0K9PUN4_ZOSMR|nr:hypothetical protein ZOSMA_15G00390 [Zostera marina]
MGMLGASMGSIVWPQKGLTDTEEQKKKEEVGSRADESCRS